jgi:glycosyltransferase involved in cell wall biosynthesis
MMLAWLSLANLEEDLNMRFTVLTPAYNRPHTLGRVYESLLAQTFKDFEWLIVDDSTTNDVQKVVQPWLKENTFVRYVKQKNSGKHVAHNNGVMQAQGEFCIILDDDDTLLPTALETFHRVWNTIPEQERGKFSGVAALCTNYDTGELLGGKFPQDVLDSDSVAINYIYHLGDDRQGVTRTDILREYLFPTFNGEKYITEGIVWNRISKTYKTRYVNETVCVKQYGMTNSIVGHLAQSPNATSTYYQEIMAAPYPFSPLTRTKLHAGYARYALHAKRPVGQIMREGSSNPLFRLAGLGIGGAFYLKDKLTNIKPDAKSQNLKVSQAKASSVEAE